MLGMKRGLVAVVLAGSLVSGVAQASVFTGVIVDTGPGSVSGPQWALSSNQGLSGEFSVYIPVKVTDVQGWINGGNGTATAAIYMVGIDKPGTELYSAAFTADAASDWDGASGLNWLLGPGTYWVAFEVRSGQTLIGNMPSPSGSPLGNEAYSSAAGTYFPYDALQLGVRIFGEEQTQTQVPEPMSLALFGLGLGGLAVTRRRRAFGAS